jgi:hypothetical protein
VFDSIKMLGFKCIHQPTCTNYPASSLLPKLATKLEVYQMDMEVTVKPSGAAIIIQLIYTGMFVMSKAAFDQGMNLYIHFLSPGSWLCPLAAYGSYSMVTRTDFVFS